MIVRWGLADLRSLLSELDIERPLLVTSERWRDLDVPVTQRFTGVRPHAPIGIVREAMEAAVDGDGIVGLGGGSAIDTAKAVSAETGLPLVAVPTTYAGAEWTPYFGMRDEERGVKTGGSGARTVAIVYEPELTLGLPRSETGGTAMNASELLQYATQAVFVLVFLLALLEYVRHRDLPRLEIAALLGGLAFLLVLTSFTRLTGFSAPWLTMIGRSLPSEVRLLGMLQVNQTLPSSSSQASCTPQPGIITDGVPSDQSLPSFCTKFAGRFWSGSSGRSNSFTTTRAASPEGRAGGASFSVPSGPRTRASQAASSFW